MKSITEIFAEYKKHKTEQGNLVGMDFLRGRSGRYKILKRSRNYGYWIAVSIGLIRSNEKNYQIEISDTEVRDLIAGKIAFSTSTEYIKNYV